MEPWFKQQCASLPGIGTWADHSKPDKEMSSKYNWNKMVSASEQRQSELLERIWRDTPSYRQVMYIEEAEEGKP